MDNESGGPIPALSVVAVVCNNQLFYSVFGDTNGCDDHDATGEASYALARVSVTNYKSAVLRTLTVSYLVVLSR